MKRIMLLLCLTLVSCGKDDGITPVSFVQLLSNPGKLEGKRVSVFGFFAVGVGAELFIDKVHAQFGDGASAITVIDTTENGEMTFNCQGKYVIIKATFDMHRGLHSLKDVERIYEPGKPPCFASQ
ncbi:hypothetical protein [Microbulbifer discodermiae]|uniref:hypothetical protein n=1 Tax=Microbulbifer sp. 2201CG32-9 TaxID=3232309 RepID=UPI00345B74D5